CVVCLFVVCIFVLVFFFQAEDGIRDATVTGVQTCALPISGGRRVRARLGSVALFLLLSVLFCALASIILGSLLWGLAVVYGTFALLGLLSLVFGLLVWVVGEIGRASCREGVEGGVGGGAWV